MLILSHPANDIAKKSSLFGSVVSSEPFTPYSVSESALFGSVRGPPPSEVIVPQPFVDLERA